MTAENPHHFTMTDKQIQDIAQSLETKPELLPYIPELVADIWALGSSPDRIYNLLQPLSFSGKHPKLLDLGCGKGAISITLAKKLNFRVIGVDAFKPFLQEAEREAVRNQVSHRCQFIHDDMRNYIQEAKEFDVVIYASIGNVLGNFQELTTKLRRMVHKSGYIVIEDGFLKGSDRIDREGYSFYVSNKSTIDQLTSHGDVLVQEIIIDEKETRELNQKYFDLISERGKSLIKRYPELTDAIEWYLKNQKEECEILDRYITGAIWLLRKADS
jgi:ubiquinone/menaquinone biosynthesis C-methylase UbiE